MHIMAEQPAPSRGPKKKGLRGFPAGFPNSSTGRIATYIVSAWVCYNPKLFCSAAGIRYSLQCKLKR